MREDFDALSPFPVASAAAYYLREPALDECGKLFTLAERVGLKLPPRASYGLLKTCWTRDSSGYENWMK